MAASHGAVRNPGSQLAADGKLAYRSTAKDLMPGMLALLAAFPLAFAIHLINRALPGQLEKSVQVTAMFLGALVVCPPVVYVLVRRHAIRLTSFAFIGLVGTSIVLVSIYLYWVSFYVMFPADILIWSEGDFVNDILKFRLGYPIYTAQVNNESFTYVPGPQLLTYLLAWLSGNPASIPVYRAIQVGYTLLTAILAAICVRKLLALSLPSLGWRDSRMWSAVWMPVLFLIGTNSLTNPFVHALHDDALAQLGTVIAYYLLLSYVSTRDRRVLVGMALLPAIGFLVKQSLVIWALFYSVQLVLDKPFSFNRVLLFMLIAFASIGAVIGACYIVWGEPFIYWIFTVLGKHGVSPLRSFRHLLDVWVYFAMGLAGGFMLLRGKEMYLFFGPWLIWLGLISSETYTSGIAWMINHIGPGSLVAGIWFVAALTRVWHLLFSNVSGRFWARNWLRVATALGIIGLGFSGMNVIRIPLPPLPQDAYRYVKDIEQQFDGQLTEHVLIDAGTWVYLKDGVIMKDRAPSIGERGYSQTGDFSGMIQRLEEKSYSKILFRNLNTPEFWYDYWLWSKSSGIKQALFDNYHVVGTINAIQTNGYETDPGYLFGEISILVPNPN